MSDAPRWQLVEPGAPVPLPLADQVHVWQAALDPWPNNAFEDLLSPSERERAARFQFPKDRRKFVTARGILRTLLGTYLHTPGSRLTLTNEPNGKPILPENPSLAFNLSHSGELALFAFSASTPLGVDVEEIRELEDAGAIVQRYFSRAESLRWHALHPAHRTRAFFDCWTRKEAYIKAVGTGLSMPLDQFEVTFGPGELPLLKPGTGHEHEVWSLFELPMFELPTAPAYAASLALPGTGWQLHYKTLRPTTAEAPHRTGTP